jgi:hypothetical protein
MFWDTHSGSCHDKFRVRWMFNHTNSDSQLRSTPDPFNERTKLRDTGRLNVKRFEFSGF